jgi:hypothetical protein
MVENTFVRRDMCQVMHQTTAQSVGTLTQRIDGLEKKIDDVKNLLIQITKSGGSE